MRICEKHNETFIWRGNRLRCRSCQLEAQKRHYTNHHDRELAKRKERLDALRIINLQIIREIKNNPCVDCGQRYPFYVMHFDHLRDKKQLISRMTTYSTEDLLREIEKCEVVCANCHAERTWQRKQASLV